MPGITVRFTDACEACGECTRGVCFVNAIRLEGERTVIGEECRGCGRCVLACPHDAVELTVDDPDVMRRAIEHLEPLFDL